MGSLFDLCSETKDEGQLVLFQQQQKKTPKMKNGSFSSCFQGKAEGCKYRSTIIVKVGSAKTETYWYWEGNEKTNSVERSFVHNTHRKKSPTIFGWGQKFFVLVKCKKKIFCEKFFLQSHFSRHWHWGNIHYFTPEQFQNQSVPLTKDSVRWKV